MSNDIESNLNSENGISTDSWGWIVAFILVSAIFSPPKYPKCLTKKQIALAKHKKKTVAKKWRNKSSQIYKRWCKRVEKYNQKHCKDYDEFKNVIKNGSFEELKNFLEKYDENQRTDC